MNLWRKVWLSVFILTGFIVSAKGQEASVIRQADSVLKARGEIYFTFEPQYLTPRLANILSIEKISDNLVYAYANRGGFSQIIKQKFPFLLRPENFLVSGLKSAAVTDPDSVYPSYPKYLKMMQEFVSQFPDMCGLYEIGKSAQGRKILALKLSSPVNSSESRPAIMLSGTIHGNELTGYKLLLQLTDELLRNYESDPLINRLLNNCIIWINPLANPDGTYFGGDNTVAAAKRFNANNTDLNRNFPDPLEGKHPDGKSWQPETIAMMDFYKNHGINLSANLHAGEVVVNYPWDTWSRLHADNGWFKAISRQYADTAQKMSNNGYMNSTANGFDRGIVNGFQWYRITGGRQDYFTYFAGGREITLELSNENMPGLAEVSSYWDYNRLSLLRFIEQSLFGVKGK
ncbi:MAG: hypothetical protein HC905_13715 [Bacteroidales bacterium]|nr:hypothetical protein [Bacteroidales bacterium]